MLGFVPHPNLRGLNDYSGTGGQRTASFIGLILHLQGDLNLHYFLLLELLISYELPVLLLP